MQHDFLMSKFRDKLDPSEYILGFRYSSLPKPSKNLLALADCWPVVSSRACFIQSKPNLRPWLLSPVTTLEPTFGQT